MDPEANLEQVIADCRNGSEHGFEQLVDMFATRCYRYFYRLTGDAAVSEDLLSELFIRLCRKIGSFKGGSFEKWLFTIASNIFHDHLRRQYRYRRLLDAKVRELRRDHPPPRSDNDAIGRVEKALRHLDDDTVELLMMRFYGQLSFKELAEIRDEPIGTTLSKVHRAIKRLRQILGETND